MRFMIFVKATRDTEAGVMPDKNLLAAMTSFNEELVKAGVMLAGEGLHPSSKGARVHFARGDTSVRGGPFSPAEELVAGFWIWQVKSKEEAIDWVKRCPAPMGPDKEAVIEIRQIFEPEDFGRELTPELHAREDLLRESLAGQTR